MALDANACRSALAALDRLQAQQQLLPPDEEALERLRGFLIRAQQDEPPLLAALDDAPEALDDAQRAYLLSFRDRQDSGRRQFILTPPTGLTPRASASGEPSGGSGSGTAAGAASGDPWPAAGGGGSVPPSRSPTDDAELLTQPALREQLAALTDWDTFDVFRVAELTEGRPLRTVALHLLRRSGLVARLRLPEQRLAAFLDEAEASYPPNPYHNSTHAADALQGLGALLAADGLAARLSDLEHLAVLLATAVHDLGHPGVNNEFLIRTNSEAALQYNDRSINENMHLAAAFRLLARPECNFLSHLPEDDYRCLRSLVISLVMATDMARHHSLVQEFASELRLCGPDLASWPPDKRPLALASLVHAADISNPARPLRLATQWGLQVQDEFFLQGDRERDLGLPVSLPCDRGTASVAASQSAFIEYVMAPAFETLAPLAPIFAARVRPHIEASLAHWREQQAAQQAAQQTVQQEERQQQQQGGSAGAGDGQQQLHLHLQRQQGQQQALGCSACR